MAMEGNMTCAVEGCIHPIYGPNNLCDQHRVSGMAIRVDKSTMVITAWYAEHGDECGIVLLNDWALGTHFGGRAGFENKLREQGFVNCHNLSTPDELEAAKQPAEGKKVGEWSGHWKTNYPWQAPEGATR